MGGQVAQDEKSRIEDLKFGFEISNLKSEILNPVNPVHPCLNSCAAGQRPGPKFLKVR
ncbi:MAG TPA: hypothetical protein VLJ61_00435 [Pyrinomonadaceae bacterium]|nr:hypothetical protein [Pyrinomonadaceae bacterium]